MYDALNNYPLLKTDKHQALKISQLSCCTELNFGHDFLWVSPLQRAQLYPPSPDSFYDWPRHYDFIRNSQRFMAYIPLHEGWVQLIQSHCILLQ